ncbi:acetamidase/formamidase family protein [Streptomyces sp. NPDC051569]|uniref:acetamidase/formamidase family protein n=1 Tax=Streptomyces sp. NPDC051569 TaxID=3365661 RepID=UPI0037907E01
MVLVHRVVHHDGRELVVGSTPLSLPATVPDALLCIGDGHPDQGDGEVSGAAVECGMTTRMTLDLEPSPPVRRPTHSPRPAGSPSASTET